MRILYFWEKYINVKCLMNDLWPNEKNVIKYGVIPILIIDEYLEEGYCISNQKKKRTDRTHIQQ